MVSGDECSRGTLSGIEPIHHSSPKALLSICQGWKYHRIKVAVLYQSFELEADLSTPGLCKSNVCELSTDNESTTTHKQAGSFCSENWEMQVPDQNCQTDLAC